MRWLPARRYNAPMTLIPASSDHFDRADRSSSWRPERPTTGLPVGLTVEDARRIAEALEASHAESTRLLYAHVWRVWERWCDHRGIRALPADPAALAAYLVERAAEGTAVVSLNMARTAIRHVHRQHGLPNPAETELVRQVQLGLRRTYGVAPKRLARPLTVADVGQIVAAIDRTKPIGVRDAAIILLGFASAMRGSELAHLRLADVTFKPAGLLLTIRQSKTDQEGYGQLVAVARGAHPLTDPVGALSAWLWIRGGEPGALFTRIWHRRISDQPLGNMVVARMLRERAVAAGLDGTRITAHSLRAGHATSAAMAGVPLSRIAAQTRHKDIGVLVNRYIRPMEALEMTSSKDLGL